MNRRAGLALGWAWVAAIVFFSLAPGLPHSGVEGGDKLAHFIAYAAPAWWFSQLYFGKARLAHGIGFVALGVGLEFAQGALGHRSFDLADMAANALGVAAGLAAAGLLRVKVRAA